MRILQPSTWEYDCKCECGAHFIAQDQDFVSKEKILRDVYSSSIYLPNTTRSYLEILKCPCCTRFVVKKTDAPILNSSCAITAEEMLDDDVPFWLDDDKRNFNKIKVEVKRWDEIPELRAEYKSGQQL